MQNIFFSLLCLSAGVVEAADLAPRAAAPLCNTLNSCYSRFTQASTASAYCASFMSVTPATKHVTVTSTAAPSTKLVTKIVTLKGTTTVVRTLTTDVGASYVTSYQPCTIRSQPQSAPAMASTAVAKRQTSLMSSSSPVYSRGSSSISPPSSSPMTAPGCIEYLVAAGAAATSSACKCIVVTPTNTVLITKTVTPKPSTYTWTGTVSLKSTVHAVTTVTETPTYTVVMDPLPCTLTSATSSILPTTTPTATLTWSSATSISSSITTAPTAAATNLIIDPSFELVPSSSLYRPGAQGVENWLTLDNTYFATSFPGSGEANFTTSWGNQFAVLGNNVDPIGTNGASGALYYNSLTGLDPSQTYTLTFEQAIHFNQPATGENCLVGVAFIGARSGQRAPVINELNLTPGTPVYTGFSPVSYTFTPSEQSGRLEWYTFCNGMDYSQRFFAAIDMVSLSQVTSSQVTSSQLTSTPAPVTSSTSTASTSSQSWESSSAYTSSPAWPYPPSWTSSSTLAPATSSISSPVWTTSSPPSATFSTVATPSSNLISSMTTTFATSRLLNATWTTSSSISSRTTSTSTSIPQPSNFPAPATCNNQGLQWELFTNMGTYYHGPTWYQFENYLSGMTQNVPQLTGTTSTISGFIFQPNANDQTTLYNNPTLFNAEHWCINHQGYILAPQTGVYTFMLGAVDDYLAVWVGPTAAAGWTTSNAAGLTDIVLPPANFTYSMTAGQYYPFRAIYANSYGGGGYAMYIVNPDGTNLTTSTQQGNPYIVSYSCDGTSAPALPAWAA